MKETKETLNNNFPIQNPISTITYLQDHPGFRTGSWQQALRSCRKQSKLESPNPARIQDGKAKRRGKKRLAKY